jgi:GGDEF domain-containing protein
MSVLSFRKSVDQLDVVAERQLALQRILSRCIRSTGEYAIELKKEDTRTFRAHLEQLAIRGEQTLDPAEAEEIHSSYRGELRDYRDLTQTAVDRLRSDVAEAMASVQTFLANAMDSGTDHQLTLRKEFDRLEVTAQSGDLNAIQVAIQHAAETAMKSCAEIQRSQEIIISQLQDEIRNLHKEVRQEQRAALSDPITGVWNRAKLDSRIKDLVLLNECFCVFLVGVPSLAQIGRQDPRLAPGFLRALSGRLQSVSGKNGEVGMTGRWSEEAFAIIFNLPLSGSPVTPASLAGSLSGSYTIQLDGISSEVVAKVQVRAVERGKDSQESPFYMSLGQNAFEVTAR